MSTNEFRQWWLEHVKLSSRIPGLQGYRINFVNDVMGADSQRDDVAFDGTSELWFGSVSDMDPNSFRDIPLAVLAHSTHLKLAAAGRYAPDHVLVIGDAPGDRKAAEANGVLFYPINPGEEERSWERFYQEAMGRFFAGSYAGAMKRP